jgi:hypothetical protein
MWKYACLMLLPALPAPAEEILYNGIQLPSPWPPSRNIVLPYQPMEVPYLKEPPRVIPIDTGRQLFVDDFLIAETSLTRVYHQAQYHPETPVLKPDKPWETTERGPASMVFSDGVWYDPADRLFKMWYMAGYTEGTAMATSRDGIHWEKPTFDVVAGTNIVMRTRRGSTIVWLDSEEANPGRRFKMFRQVFGRPPTFALHFSPDGIHWSDTVALSGSAKDRSTLFWNPFRKVWVFSLKEEMSYVRGDLPQPQNGRMRRYHEHPSIVDGMDWVRSTLPAWVGADALDPRREDLKLPAQLYNLDAVAYESLIIGLFTIFRGEPKDRAKPNELVAGYSRDGFHWYRPDRRALIPVSERHGDWNWGNVQSAGGVMLVVGDQLYFYVSGRAGVNGSEDSGVCTTGLATLRRDGFASMRAPAGGAGGTLTTRVVRFSGSRLFVNAAVRGELRAEVLDEAGRVIAPYSAERCEVVRGDKTLIAVRWKDGEDLSELHGKPLRLRFHLRDGDLYSFWVSPNVSGASRGYVGAGGPGFTGPRDTVGVEAYRGR